MTATWGEPSSFSVTRWASGPDAISSRAALRGHAPPSRRTARSGRTVMRSPHPWGARSWRWRWDLNPRRGCPVTRFRGVLLRPLGHATAEQTTRARRSRKKAVSSSPHSSRPDLRHDLDPVVDRPVAHHVPHRTGRSGLGVPGAEHHPVDPRQDQRPGAHQAGLEGHDQRAAVEPPRPAAPRRGPQRQDLRVRRRVTVGLPPVRPGADGAPGRVHDDGPHRDVGRSPAARAACAPGRAPGPSTRRTPRGPPGSPQGVELLVEAAGLADAGQHGARVVRLVDGELHELGRRDSRGPPAGPGRRPRCGRARTPPRPPGRSGRAPAPRGRRRAMSSGSSSSSRDLVVVVVVVRSRCGRGGLVVVGLVVVLVHRQRRPGRPGPRGRRCRRPARASRRTGCASTRAGPRRTAAGRRRRRPGRARTRSPRAR